MKTSDLFYFDVYTWKDKYNSPTTALTGPTKYKHSESGELYIYTDFYYVNRWLALHAKESGSCLFLCICHVLDFAGYCKVSVVWQGS